MKSISIERTGRDGKKESKSYVMVNERLIHFRENYKGYSLTTEIVELTDARAVFRAVIKDEGGREIADGLAFEMQAASYINKTSYIENCQTSAWGRALANMGIGIDDGVASADEITNAMIISDTLKQKVDKNNISTLEMLIEEYNEATGKSLTLAGIVKKKSLKTVNDMTFEMFMEIKDWFLDQIKEAKKK